MIITKKALSSPHVLRGIGATLALPLLDSMVPAFTPSPRRRPTRRAVSASCTCPTAS